MPCQVELLCVYEVTIGNCIYKLHHVTELAVCEDCCTAVPQTPAIHCHRVHLSAW